MRIRDLTGIEDETIVAEQVLALDDPSQTLKITLGQLSDFVSRYLDLKTGAFRPVMTHAKDPTAGALMYSGAWGLGSVVVNMNNAEILSSVMQSTQVFNQGGGSSDNHFNGMFGAGLHMAYGQDASANLSANLFVGADGNLWVEWLDVKADGSGTNAHHINKVYSPLNQVPTNQLKGNVESIPNGDNMRDYFTYHPTAVYRSAGTDVLGGPPGWQYGPLHFKLHGIRASDGLAEFGAVTAWNADGTQWQCNLVNGGWGEWRKVYDSINLQPATINAIYGDSCNQAGFVSNDANQPYFRHTSTGSIIVCARSTAVLNGFRCSGYLNTGGDVRDTGSRVLVGIYATNGWDNPTNQETRQLQYAINGAWFDVPAA